MFRITQDPSSGSIDSYLIKTARSGLTVLVVCAVGVWRHIQDLWCVCALQRNKHTTIHVAYGLIRGVQKFSENLGTISKF
jgi:hypothetical protein